MKKRVINFGCSHAAGVEIAGRVDEGTPHVSQKHPDNIRLNFGNLVAKEFNRDFRITARPGNSNRNIYHDAISADIQPGDICLMAWTYFERDMWINPHTGDNTLPHCQIDHNHTIGSLTEKHHRQEHMSRHPFIKHNKNPIIKSVSKAYFEYFHLRKISIIRYLEWYYATNMTIKQRGGIPINFQFDASYSDWSAVYKMPFTNDDLYSADRWRNNKMESYWPVEEISYYSTNGHGDETAAIKKYYDNDPYRLTWELYNVTQPIDGEMLCHEVPDGTPATYKQWYTNEYHGGPYLKKWPDNRRGHFGPHGHKILSEHLIKFINSNVELI